MALVNLDTVRTALIKNGDGSFDRIFFDVVLDTDALMSMARRAAHSKGLTSRDGALLVAVTSRRTEPKP
jgi:hypothetical protein